MLRRKSPTQWHKRGPSALIAAALVCAFTLTAGIAQADSVDDEKKKADQRVAQLQQQLEGTSADLGLAWTNLQTTKAKIPAAQARLNQAQSLQASAEATERSALARANEAAQKLAVAQANERRATKELGTNSTALRTEQDTLDAYAADVFQGGQSENTLAMAFGAADPQDLAARLTMAETASSFANEKITTLANSKVDVTAKQAYLKSVQAEIATLKRQADASLQEARTATAQAVAARANAQSAQNELNGLMATQQKQVTTLNVRKQSESAELETTQKEQARLSAVLKERARIAKIREAQRQARLRAEAKKRQEALLKQQQAGNGNGSNTGSTNNNGSNGGTPSTGGGYLSYAANGPITSGFGMRFHPVLHRWMLHDGLDFGIACGTPVYAAAPGEVISAGYNSRGWGNQVIIDHGIHSGVDLVTTYNHLSSIVKYSGNVSRGQLIGYSGTTGYSTGCHLHFGVYEDGTPVNPLKWL